jgi:hypothetical protein
MGTYTQPLKVKLVIGMLGKDQAIINRARQALEKIYGTEEEVLPCIPFTWTNYYEDEIGSKSFRCFVTYENLIERENIVKIKRRTNSLEKSFSRKGLRPVNLDPGYLTLGQFFLASTKDQRQRVYLGRGIFLEPSLFFKDGKFYPFDWTYRDYRSKAYLEYFKRARSKLAYQLRQGRPYSQRKKISK